MSIGRNRFEYGHIIDQNTLEQTADEIKREVCERIDFKNGIIREINEVQFKNGIIWDVRWKEDVHFILRVNRWSGRYSYLLVLNKAAGGFLGDWSIPGTVYTIAVTGIDAMERNIALNICIDNGSLSTYVEVLCIDANIVSVDGKILLTNVTYDYHTLQIRLGAYNKANGTNYSITELIKSAEAPNDDDHKEQKQLYNNFMEWYSLDGEGKTGKVAEYGDDLEQEYDNLRKEYFELSDTLFGKLNYKQIQEVEKHLEDPAYEIDVTLWK